MALMPAGMAAADHAPDARDTSNVCPSDDPNDYTSSFEDVGSGPHWVNIVCMADYGITEGTGDGTNYSPRIDVTRGQMASFIARFIEDATGETMPTGPRDRFDDVPETDGQYVHSSNIHKLAEADIVRGTAASDGDEYAPQRPVNRMQMGTFIRHAISYIDDGDTLNLSEPPESDHSYFPDKSAPVHLDNVDAIANVGIVEGFEDGTYGPTLPVLRDQMASYVMRAYDYVVEQGLIDIDPEPGPPADLTLDPQESTNPVNTDHTVTATVVDEDGLAVADDTDVRFDVFDRNVGEHIESGTATTSDGDAEFTYSFELEEGEDPFDEEDASREDVIVACTGDQRCTTEDTADIDSETGEVLNLRDDRPSDQAEKDWEPRVATELNATQQDDVNSTARAHTVDVELLDQAGDPVEGQSVTFEVYRDDGDNGFDLIDRQSDTTAVTPEEAEEDDDKTGDNAGKVAFSYNTDPEAEDGDSDVIVVCHASDGDDTTVCTEGDDLDDRAEAEEDEFILFADDLEKSWVEFDFDEAGISLSTSGVTQASGIDGGPSGNTLDAAHIGWVQFSDQFGRVIDHVDVLVDALAEEEVDFQITGFRQFEGDDDEYEGVSIGSGGLDLGQSGGSGTFIYTAASPALGDYERLDGADQYTAASAEDTYLACFTDQPTCAVPTNGGTELDVAPGAVTTNATWLNVEDASDGDSIDGRVIDEALEFDAEDDVEGGVVHIFDPQTLEFLAVPVDPAQDDFTVDGEESDAQTFAESISEGDLVSVTYDASTFVGSTWELRNRTDAFVSLLTGDAGQLWSGPEEISGEVPANREGGAGLAFVETYTGEGVNEYCQQNWVTQGSDDGSFEDSPGHHLHDGGFEVNGPVVVGFDPVSDATDHSGDCGQSEFDLTDVEEGAIGFYVNVHTSTYPGGLVRGQLGGSMAASAQNDGGSTPFEGGDSTLLDGVLGR